jgi:hypothetical protein
MKIISTTDLNSALNSPTPPRLIDTRLDDDFEAAHLPGAVNNCVFEVAFLDRMNEIAPDKSAPLCLYGAA